jgi:hypothetical protein
MRRILMLAAAAAVLAVPAAAGAQAPPGYLKGDASLARSPVSLEEFKLLKATVLFTDEERQRRDWSK